MSDTPRTDAAIHKGCGPRVDPHFARTLERELAVAQKEKEAIIGALIAYANQAADSMEGEGLPEFAIYESEMCWAVEALKVIGVKYDPCSGERTAILQSVNTAKTTDPIWDSRNSEEPKL